MYGRKKLFLKVGAPPKNSFNFEGIIKIARTQFKESFCSKDLMFVERSLYLYPAVTLAVKKPEASRIN